MDVYLAQSTGKRPDKNRNHSGRYEYDENREAKRVNSLEGSDANCGNSRFGDVRSRASG